MERSSPLIAGVGRERGTHLALKPDMASLATGSVNIPIRVYDNAPDLVEWLAGEMKANGRGVATAAEARAMLRLPA